MNQNPDDFEWTDQAFRATRPAHEVLPPAFFDGLRQAQERRKQEGRGKQKAPTKQQVTLRLDADVLAALKQTGQGWQTRLNQQLRTLFLG
jgi:uncharacterized protein (DUF4415 family)